MDWNVVVTVKPGPHFEGEVLGVLARFGRFRPTYFRDVIFGHADDVDGLLDGIRSALEAGAPWAAHVARVIPAESVFAFIPETLAEHLRQAVAPLAARMTDGSFCVRLERRGYAGKVMSQDIERALGEHLQTLAAAQGKRLHTEFADPDFVIAIETLGEQCGVALLPRAVRAKYPFVQVR